MALFFPGVHGGVGPCRAPGANFDDDALFPTVVRRLAQDARAGVDCYRCSWPFMRPRLQYAIGGACRVLQYALLEATEGVAPEHKEGRELRVFLVGHSLGGAVVLHAAEVMARHFGPDGRGGRQAAGLEQAIVRVDGVCTLNAALDLRQLRAASGGEQPFQALASSRLLLVSGDADQVVAPEATTKLYEALPAKEKRHLSLPGGTHDLYAYKAQLVQELTNFILGDEPAVAVRREELE